MITSAERELLVEIEQFLYREAWLLEQGKFDEWLALMTDDVTYYIPNRAEASAIADDAMIAYDDLRALKLHVARMYDKRNPALNPPARVKYFVTNVAVVERSGEETTVRSSVLLYIVRESDVRHHPISCEYRLRSGADGWKIAYKKVYLLENDRPLRPLPLI
jgi:benzoate/toluate 1,2-dioxygenase subunit beta